MWLNEEQKAPIRAEDEKALFEEYKRTGSKRIRDKFVMSVYAIACREARRFPSTNVPEEDRIQAAMAGVVEAIDHYDPERGRFNTYATFWIKRELMKLVQDERTIVSGTGLCKGRADQDGRRAVRTIYVDDEITYSNDDAYFEPTSRLDMLINSPATAHTTTEENNRAEHLQEMIAGAKLTEAERWVLTNRWLTRSGDRRTLQQLADERLCTREWIRKLEVSAFNKIRKYARRRNLNV